MSSKNLLLEGQRTTVPQGDPQVFTDGSFIKKALLCSVGLSLSKAGPSDKLLEASGFLSHEASLRRIGQDAGFVCKRVRSLQKAPRSP